MTIDRHQNLLQPSLDDIGTPLADTTFCVVDLETTGSGPEATITEFGAVKVRGGQILGEFGTLVNPCVHIPGFIAVLTGITNQMVTSQPTLGEVLPSWLEFSRGTVLVAHNARFDIGFLKRACEQFGYPWPGNMVVDTVALARQALLRGEVPNVKLHTLADHFHAATQPNHRALSDARATVDVLHGLLERVGNLGVLSLEDLKEFEHRVSPQRRAKRTWASELPERPGVYTFYAQRPGQDRQVLYVGKASNIRRRVRTYFTSSETRPRMDEMVRIATGVDAVVCATELEAQVRELRTIAAHAPRYNRRSKRQDKVAWVKLTCERFPRLSVVAKPADDQATYWGPFSSRSAAQTGCEAIYDAYPLRQCTTKIAKNASGPACALAELGKCLAPCLGSAADDYAELTKQVREAMTGDLRPTLALIGRRIVRLSEQQRYEQAEVLTTRLRSYVAASQRLHRLQAISRCSQIVAAQWIASPAPNPGWQIHVIRYGKLAAAACAAPGSDPIEVANRAVQLAEVVWATPHDMPSASVEEAELIARWLETPGVRLIDIDGEWSMPVHGGVDRADLPELTVGAGARDNL